jgi:excisionase family DNA binding protein
VEAIEDRLCAALARANAGMALVVLQRAGCDVDGVRRGAARHAAGEPDLPIVSPSWLTVEQAAEVLQVAVRTVELWCLTGRLPAHRPVGKRAWRVSTEGTARMMVIMRLSRTEVAGQGRDPAA